MNSNERKVKHADHITVILDELSWLIYDDPIREQLLQCKNNIQDIVHGYLIEPDSECIRILQEKGKIPAIKRYRELTGFGLKRSKEAIDKVEEKQLMIGCKAIRRRPI